VQSRFDGKVALVTGGNSGIGLAAALEFARCGARTVLAARRRQQGADSIERIRAAGGEAAFVVTDVTDSCSVRDMVDFCLATFGRLDFAYNNAGIVGHVHTGIADADEDAFDRVIATNLRGTWLSMKYQVPVTWPPAAGR
jgi:NAD(P)-dependent dehydrogenase (short-subunit alcohol dehydrogenase family)